MYFTQESAWGCQDGRTQVPSRYLAETDGRQGQAVPQGQELPTGGREWTHRHRSVFPQFLCLASSRTADKNSLLPDTCKEAQQHCPPSSPGRECSSEGEIPEGFPCVLLHGSSLSTHGAVPSPDRPHCGSHLLFSVLLVGRSVSPEPISPSWHFPLPL